MSGLTILVVGADPARARAALMTALASAALGGSVRMFFHEDAVTLLDRTAESRALVEEALAAGVAVIACQTGLATYHLAFDQLVEGVEAGGLVSVLAAAAENRLLSF